MTSITATPNASTGAVDITLTQTAAVAKILRGNSYGTQEVRASSGQFPTATSGTTILSDYECANGQNVYSAVDSSGAQLATVTVTVVIDRPWLLVPIAVNYSEKADTVTAYSSGRSSNSNTLQIIGRADPIVVLGKLGTRTGSLEVFTSSISDAERLVRVFSRGETVLLKQAVAGMDMYFTADSLSVDPYTVSDQASTRYKLTVRYTEVIRPYGDLAGALGWTYDALSTSYSSYDAVAAAYATYDDLTLGAAL